MTFTGENHTVDTYVSLERVALREVMTQFADALSAIGAPAHAVREWATEATYDALAHEFTPVLQPFFIGTPRIEAWPGPSVLTPDDIPQLNNNWIKCGVFFRTDDLCVWTGDNIAYLTHATPLLWSVVSAFARIGSNTGVFLEHEGQNPAGWQLEKSEAPGFFEMAVIPPALRAIYEPLREHMHATSSADGGLALAPKTRWPTAPWFT